MVSTRMRAFVLTLIIAATVTAINSKEKKKKLTKTAAVTISSLTTTTASWMLSQNLTLLSNNSQSTSVQSTAQRSSVFVDGDIILGGLFPVHERLGSEPCGAIQADRGIQRMEAMVCGINCSNNNPRPDFYTICIYLSLDSEKITLVICFH